MTSNSIPFQTTDWSRIPKITRQGETGFAYSQTLQFGVLRIRMVEYSENYKADHWCEKGHIIYCLEGEMETELSNGEKYLLTKGMTYQVSDDMSSHRSSSKEGVKLMVIDGTFLNTKSR